MHDENWEYSLSSEKQTMWEGAESKSLLLGSVTVVMPIHRKNSYIQVSDSLQVRYGYLNYLMMYRDGLDNIVAERVTLKPSLK